MHHENAWKTSFKDYLNSVQETSSLIETNLFRPPYGKLSRKLTHEISKTHQLIMWSFMAYDFDDRISHDLIRSKAKKHIQAGSIIVLHDNEKFTVNEKLVFELIVSVLQEKGLRAVAIQ
jgi:peptidoglycan/xylan/chitin deacetylase (PgdA/CDA1 family)